MLRDALLVDADQHEAVAFPDPVDAPEPLAQAATSSRSSRRQANGNSTRLSRMMRASGGGRNVAVGFTTEDDWFWAAGAAPPCGCPAPAPGEGPEAQHWSWPHLLDGLSYTYSMQLLVVEQASWH